MRDLGGDRGGRTQGQIGLHLGHSQFDRAVAKNLQDQGAVELDVGLHQAGRRDHLSQQMLHGHRVRPGRTSRLTPAQDLGPTIRHTYQHAAHWQAFK